MQLMLATAGILLAIAVAGATERACSSEGIYDDELDGGFVAYGHMANHPTAVNWYVANGMNGIEADLNINLDGSLGNFQHGTPCDCTCSCAIGSTCSDTNACRILWDATGSHCNRSHCNAATSSDDLAEHILGKSEIAIFYIGSKMDPIYMTADALKDAGKNVVGLIERHGNAYKGQIIVSVSKDSANSLAYLKAVVAAAANTPTPNRYFVTVDGMGSQFAEAANALVSISKNRVSSTGISICSQKRFADAVRLGAFNAAEGGMAGSAVWTLDAKGSMESYFKAGATALVTNDPLDLSAVTVGARMATPSLRTLLPATTDIIMTDASKLMCDCSYHPGGCEISKAAPSGFACVCDYIGIWTCSGEITRCIDPDSSLCKDPTASYESCLLGGGDCEAYNASGKCDCNYHAGGCEISEVAPRYSACKCNYNGGFTCGGSVVQCLNPSSSKCTAPDKDFDSCLLGGGDCGAYAEENNCDCDYHPGGCEISEAAPKDTACKCSYKDGFTCGGTVTQCLNSNSRKCTTPDKAFDSCLLGGGDCGAYDAQHSCDCDYHPGGCTISKAAPKDAACKCSYKGAFTCGGGVVECTDPDSDKCKFPDTSKTSCRLGGGDCDGY